MKDFLVKNWRKLAVVSCLLLIVAVFTAGCMEYTTPDGKKVVKLKPETTETLDKAIEVLPFVQQGVSGAAVAFPALAGVLGIIAGAVGAFTETYRRFRPKLTAETDRATKYGESTKALVYAIERYKANDPEGWIYLKKEIKDELMDKIGPEALAVIEALVQSIPKTDTK